ncbi:hypothetical protein D3C86_1704960 [compost metagenome]
MNQRASKLPEQPSTNGASAVLCVSSAQTERKRSKASALASRKRIPASVSLRPRPSFMKRLTPRCSSSTLSYVQLLRSLTDAVQAGGRLEGAKCIERGKVVAHFICEFS